MNPSTRHTRPQQTAQADDASTQRIGTATRPPASPSSAHTPSSVGQAATLTATVAPAIDAGEASAAVAPTDSSQPHSRADAPSANATQTPAPTAPAGAIVLESISVRYQGAPVLRQVSARFACGQRWVIVGANGCGKSTLLKAAMRLLHCESGQVHWQNLRRADIAYLPQQAGIDRNLPVRVQDLVALGLWHELRWWRGLRNEQWARVHAALDQVGLLAQAREPIAALSSGQFQRVLFARMLVQRARMLLLDEPFNAVDEATTADLLQVLHGCARQGAGIVAVVHDQEQARCHFDHILRLDQTSPPMTANAMENASTAVQQGTRRIGITSMGAASTRAADDGAATTSLTATSDTNHSASAAPPAQYSAHSTASQVHPSSPHANTCSTGTAQVPTEPGLCAACFTGAFSDQGRDGG